MHAKKFRWLAYIIIYISCESSHIMELFIRRVFKDTESLLKEASWI